MDSLNLAVVGLGRIGVIHAFHADELEREGAGCRLTALVDVDQDKARKLAADMGRGDVTVYGSVEDLVAADAADAAVISTPTGLHQEHAEALIAAGKRVLLEKPMTSSLADDRAFAARLDRESPDALMLAFQRRFDGPLRRAKELLQEGAIGRPFRIVSVLEDSGPLPDGYDSAGLLMDMSVHNVDEILWILGRRPRRAASLGSRLYSHRLTTADEDFDAGLIHLWFDDELTGQIEVSRNHVPGYRVETWIFGEEGHIHVGRFDQRRFDVTLEAYGREAPISQETFAMRDYGGPMPEFVNRFGPAYKAELQEFVERCREGKPFTVNHRDGLAAMEVIDAGQRGALTEAAGAVVESGA